MGRLRTNCCGWNARTASAVASEICTVQSESRTTAGLSQNEAAWNYRIEVVVLAMFGDAVAC